MAVEFMYVSDMLAEMNTKARERLVGNVVEVKKTPLKFAPEEI